MRAFTLEGPPLALKTVEAFITIPSPTLTQGGLQDDVETGQEGTEQETLPPDLPMDFPDEQDTSEED